ncbi:MAG: DUF1549 and DUF1553 domain-containing protein, partial [Planctomycetales bacterium]
MMRSLLGIGVVLCASLSAIQAEETDKKAAEPHIPGLGDPGKLQELVFEGAKELTLRGPDARLQLIVTGKYESGQTRDLTREVTYDLSPKGIVSVGSTGLALPEADGKVNVTVKTKDGMVGTTVVSVENFVSELPINFKNQITPIFTKFGCNSGGCHGKASGQNGFKLSLLGFYPNDDYEFLVKEGRGRRLFPAAPDESLLLTKSTNRVAHGGGRRLDPNSHEYRLVRRWIAQGMPYGSEEDPKVVRIQVVPPFRTMDRGTEQQVQVIAHYSDGSTEDVTRMTQFEPNDPEMAETSETGLVKTMDLTGDVGIMARYQANVDVFRAAVPLGLKLENLPQPKNYIDEKVFAKLEVLGIPPSPRCDDATFLRRVSVDITGKLPTSEQSQQFLADQSADKRDKLIDRLLDSVDYADYFANKWSGVLRNKRRQPQHARGTFAFHSWIRESMHKNKPYDQFVREIVAASGEMTQNPPVVWYREVNTINQQVEDTAQLFLGLRIQCARCHHHPFERWSQNDYYGFSAFFAQVGRKNGVNGLNVKDDARIYHKRGSASAKNPRNGDTLTPTGLASPTLELDPREDPRQALADWMADPKNPFFAPALVNRYWKHFFSRGLVDPEDDMRVTNPASNPELLKALADNFIKSGFDLKNLVREICRSNTYQLSSEPNDYNVKDKQNFSRYYPKRLNAEVLYDAVLQVTNNTTNFKDMPMGTRAVQLPDNAVTSYFLTVFGKPQGDTACECERSSEANLAQSL